MSEAALREAATRHLLRHGGTAANLVRVLDRRIARWAQALEAGGGDHETITVEAARWREVARGVVAAFATAGAVNDAAFAESRARRLQRSGRSRRAVVAHLGAKGVAGALAEETVPKDEEAEFVAALSFAKRRRVGPFGAGEMPPEARLKVLGAFARAGFAGAVARRALACGREEAEEILLTAG